MSKLLHSEVEMRRGFIVSLATAVGTVLVTTLIIFFAKGYWYNPQTGKVIRTGLLAASSSPTGASVFIDNKLTDATNTTIKLESGSYLVRIEKEGYQPWTKQIKISEEVVTPVFARLFSAFPDLQPLTRTGAAHPVLSPNGLVLAYTVLTSDAAKRREHAGIWTLPLNGKRPFGLLGGDKPIQIAADSADIAFSRSFLVWSPDGTRLLAIVPDHDTEISGENIKAWVGNPKLIPNNLKFSTWLLLPDTEADRQLPQGIRDLAELLSNWKDLSNTQSLIPLALYPDEVRREATAAATMKFSADDKRLLLSGEDKVVTVVWQEFGPVEKRAYVEPKKTYLPVGIKEATRTDEATTPASLQRPQPKEVVAQFSLPEGIEYLWLPESENIHLIVIEKGSISTIEADSTNKTTLYTGEFLENFVAPWPDGNKLIILTNLNRAAGTPANLYTLSLK
jgi:hypothetical protein